VKRFWASSRLYHLITKLKLVVPITQGVEDVHRNEIDAPRKDACFNHSQEETSGEKSRVVLHETLSDGNAPKNEHA